MNKEHAGQEQRNQEIDPDTVHTNRSVFAQRVLLAVGIGTFIIILLLVFWTTIDVLLLIFASALMAIFLRGLSDLIRKYTHLSGGLSLVIVLFSLIGIFGIVTWFIVPKVTEQIDQLVQTLPQSIQQLRDQLMQYTWVKRLLTKVPSINEIMSGKMNVLSKIGSFFSATFGLVANFLIIIIVGLFLSINPKSYIKGIVKLVPIKKRKRAQEVLNNVEKTLFWWLVGKIISMAIIAMFTGFGLNLLGIPVAMALGFIAGIFTFIPNIGPILSAIPAVLLALMQSPVKAFYIVLLYLAIQGIESYIITPYIERRATSIPIALVIIAQVLMGVLLGFLGLVFATPLVAAIIVLVKMLYLEDTLGDTAKSD
ncbi:MAG: hypothetical protein JETT_1355 [Candidatus Jettenia ecosi]|uniref:AI-2E family transporter n=1 Tax=Candidatus Jettenia ecosi TaxID=2494326 RepID=A0A533QC67_9BACT|nr:MAG: hypothetical protein JETT_1355 [Candidatus Jettenia ecosi]